MNLCAQQTFVTSGNGIELFEIIGVLLLSPFSIFIYILINSYDKGSPRWLAVVVTMLLFRPCSISISCVI